EGWAPALAAAGGEPRPTSPHEMSLSALHLAVLDDGRRLPLLDDRGWTTSGPPDVWRNTSIEEVEETARTVVGPDEPYGSHTPADMVAEHWAYLADILSGQGVLVDATDLSRLPHDVELSERLRTRITST